MKKQRRTGFLALTAASVMLLFLAGCSHDYTFTQATDEQTSQNAEVQTENGSSPTVADGLYTALIEVENYGTITVELNADTAPETVGNFISLVEEGFYDGLTFHRIMDGFMIQGGDPNANGTGGSGKTIKGEFKANGVENNLSHIRGAISMARSQKYDSASSQFFIVHEDSIFLDGNYAVFGYVTDGMEVVDAICEDARPTDNNGSIPSAEQPVIQSITLQ